MTKCPKINVYKPYDQETTNIHNVVEERQTQSRKQKYQKTTRLHKLKLCQFRWVDYKIETFKPQNNSLRRDWIPVFYNIKRDFKINTEKYIQELWGPQLHTDIKFHRLLKSKRFTDWITGL